MKTMEKVTISMNEFIEVLYNRKAPVSNKESLKEYESFENKVMKHIFDFMEQLCLSSELDLTNQEELVGLYFDMKTKLLSSNESPMKVLYSYLHSQNKDGTFIQKKALEFRSGIIFYLKTVTEVTSKITKEKKGSNDIDYGPLAKKCQRNIRALEIIKQQSNFNVTDQEKEELKYFSGFGGLPHLFNESDKRLEKERTQLKSLVTKKEYDSLRSSTLNGHFTPIDVIDYILSAIKRIGFKAGKVLEPAMGVGNFIARLKEDNDLECEYTGIEIDPMTYAISKCIHPDITSRNIPFEETNYTNEFDLVIGNVPFGNYKVYDPMYKDTKMPIHDYFIIKSLDAVKEKGIVALITSTGTLDKSLSEFKILLDKKGILLNAIRLPNNTFTKSANTKVATDILFIQKKSGCNINDNLKLSENGIPNIFEKNPLLFIQKEKGKHVTGRFGKPSYEVIGDENWKIDLKETLNTFSRILTTASSEITITDKLEEKAHIISDSIEYDTTLNLKEYEYMCIEDKVYQRNGSTLNLVKLKGIKLIKAQYLIKIKNVLLQLINSQINYEEQYIINGFQRELNVLYDLFISKYGYINLSKNYRVINEDPDLSLILALEEREESPQNEQESDSGNFVKADIFSKVLFAEKEHKVIETPIDAMYNSLDSNNCIDLDYMSNILNQTTESILEELDDKVIFNPQSGIYELTSLYLSGDIRAKLDFLEGKDEYKYQYNELEKVLPEPIKIHDIYLKLGSYWIPTNYIIDFICEIMEITSMNPYSRPEVIYVTETGTWSIKHRYYTHTLSCETYGTSRREFSDLFNSIINSKDIQVFDNVRENGRDIRVLNKEQTILAKQKATLIQDKFTEWITDDYARCKALEELYNNKFNRIVETTYDGSHLTFEGMNANIQLRQSQLNGIQRILVNGNTMLAHTVGAGKTFLMIAAGMKLKSCGITKKNLIIVPNHLVKQWARDCVKLFPSAKILATTKYDFTPKNRKRFLSRITLGDWDIVVMAHSTYKLINMSKDYTVSFIENDIFELEDSLSRYKSLNDKNYNQSITFSIKEIERSKKSLETKLKRITDKEHVENLITFEQLNFDCIFVDEADIFKNLGFSSKMTNISGVNSTGSQAAYDMLMKLRYIQKTKFGVFATGTPVSNSMSELFTMQRYLQFDFIKELGLHHFDAWASTFGEVVSEYEISPDGKTYQLKSRFKKFHNMPELMSMIRQIFDIKTNKDLNLPLPTLKGGKPNIITVQPTRELENYQEAIVERSKAIKNGIVDKSEDNQLLICTDGKKSALDIRLVDDTIISDQPQKVDVAADGIYSTWDKYKKERLTQMVFCDLSTPRKEFNVYDELKSLLIHKGIPSEEIAFIHQAKSDAHKELLFNAVNEGKIRILIGSTAKMGPGVNAQKRLQTLWHLDCPWRPRDIEQREGRILRQGNLCLEMGIEVTINRVVTKGSFDTYSWQTVENKGKFIAQVMNGNSEIRSVDEIGGAVFSYAEVKAMASSNPLILEKFKLDTRVKELDIAFKNYKYGRYSMTEKIKNLPKRITIAESRLKGLNLIYNTMRSKTDVFEFSIENNIYNNPKEVVKWFKSLTKDLGQDVKMNFGTYRGLNVSITNKIAYISAKDSNVSFPIKSNHISTSFLEFIDMFLDENHESNVREIEETIAKIQKELDVSKREVDKPFKYEEEFKSVKDRKLELDTLLQEDGIKSA